MTRRSDVRQAWRLDFNFRVTERKAPHATVVADLHRRHAAVDDLRPCRVKVIDLQGDRRGREIEAIRIVGHHRQLDELEGELLISEADLDYGELASLLAVLLDHAHLIDPEPAAGLRVIDTQARTRQSSHATEPLSAHLGFATLVERNPLSKMLLRRW